MDNRRSKIVKIGVIVLLVIASTYILWPLVGAIVTGILLAFVFYPVYNKLNQKTKSTSLSALIVSVALVLIVTGIFIFVINSLWSEAFSIYLTGKQRIDAASGLIGNCSEDGLLCTAISFAKNMMQTSQGGEFIENSLRKITAGITEFSSDFIVRLPQKGIVLFIIMFLMYYLLKDGRYLVDKFWELLSIRPGYEQHLKARVSDITYAVIYGSLMTALVQGLLAGTGYALFGIHNPVFWGLITAFAALLPFIGTGLVWIPLVLLKIMNGIMLQDPKTIWLGIGLGIYGTLIISAIDNFLKPKLIGDRGKVHPALVLLGVIGGLWTFGFVGIVLGPLILAITWTIAQMYLDTQKRGQKNEVKTKRN